MPSKRRNDEPFLISTSDKLGCKRDALRATISRFCLSANQISKITLEMEKCIPGTTGVYPSQISKYLTHGIDISSNGLYALELALPDKAREFYRKIIKEQEVSILEAYRRVKLTRMDIGESGLEGVIAKRTIGRASA